MIKDLLGSTESSSVGDSSAFGFSAEKNRELHFEMTNSGRVDFEVRWKAVSVKLWLRLTRSGDGQHCIVVSIRALSHCIERVDREVVGGSGLQAGDGEGCGSQWNYVGIQKTRRVIPAVSVNQKFQ